MYDEVMKARGKQKPKKDIPIDWDPSSPAALEVFRKAMREYTAEACKSKESARAALFATGMYTPTGRLKKQFR